MTAPAMTGDRSRWEKLLLSVGFSSLAGAVFVAYSDPAAGYELSIYTATPKLFWAGVASALVVALSVAFISSVGLYRSLSLLLATGAVFAVLALPLVRGYYYYGTADPLTHVGLAKDLARGVLSPFGMIYPGIHMLAVFITRITGYPITRSLLLIVLCFVLVYIAFVPLSVRLLVSANRATVLGLFSALLLLPINHVSTHIRVHPFTLTVLYSSLVVFLLLKAFTNNTSREQRAQEFDTGWKRERARAARAGTNTVLGTLGALAIVLTAIVLYHPQQGLNLLILLVTVCGIQLFYRLFYTSHPVSNHPTMYASTVFFFSVYTLWTVRTEWFYRLANKHISKIVGYLNGSTVAGERIQSQGSSLLAVGGSLPEMFVKLFLLSVVYAFLTAIITLFSLYHSLDDSVTEAKGLRLYISLGVVPMVLLFFVYLVGSISEMQFRHLGFIMVLATILGAVGLFLIHQRLAQSLSQPVVGVVIAVCFVLMFGLTLAPAYQSPYIHKPNLHVTEMQMDGYDTAIEHQEPRTTMRGVRVEPLRYSDATQGVTWTKAREIYYRKTVPDYRLSRLRTTLNGTQYVIVTQMDREREISAYEQIKFSQQGFRSLDRQPGVNRVMANGEVQLYYVEGSGDER